MTIFDDGYYVLKDVYPIELMLISVVLKPIGEIKCSLSESVVDAFLTFP